MKGEKSSLLQLNFLTNKKTKLENMNDLILKELDAGKISVNGADAFGLSRVALFEVSLAGTDIATAYADNDCLVEIGRLNTSTPAGWTGPDPTHIVIQECLVNVTTAAGQTLAGNFQLSATSGTLTNTALTSGDEVFGAGATYVSGTISTVGTEADINYNAAGVTIAGYLPVTAIAKDILYACTTTLLNADATAGRFTVQLRYTVI